MVLEAFIHTGWNVPVLKVFHFMADSKTLIFTVFGHQRCHLAINLGTICRRVHRAKVLPCSASAFPVCPPLLRRSHSKTSPLAPVWALSTMLKYKTGLPGLRIVLGLFCHVFTLAGLLHLAGTIREFIWDN